MINSYINILMTSQNSMFDTFRSILFNINSGIYTIVSLIFDLFFDITGYTMFDNEMIKGLFNRLFVVIGVFMLFKLCVSFISYLVNPESMKDKEKGIGKLFGRLITMLILLYVLMPMNDFNLWGDADTDAKYQANGILFGALYDFQSRVINDGAISELILGENLSVNGNVKNLNIGKNVSNTIHKAFFAEAGSCDEIAKEKVENAKNKDDLELILNDECTSGNYAGYYIFEYNGIIALIVGIGVLVIVFLFCFDVAVRMIKLGILRLLSPIPAISYIDPKSSRDGMFANYIKTLTSTYLDLFLRLAIIYLVIFILADIAQRNENLFTGSTGGIAKAIIYISLLFFAAQAPKFIMQSLGIKSKGTGLGFGAALLGGGLSGLISGATTGGITGAIGGLIKGTGSANKNFWTAAGGGQSQGSAWKIGGTEGVRFGLNDDQAKHMGIMDRGLKNMHNARMRKNLGVTGNDVKNQKAYADALAGDVNQARDLRKQFEDIINANAAGGTQKFDVTLRTADGQNIRFSNTDVHGNLLSPADLQKKIQSIDSQIRTLESNQGTAADMLKTMSTVQQNYTTYNPAPERQGHMYASYGQYRASRSKKDVGSAYYKETSQDRAPDNASSYDTHTGRGDYGGDNGPHNAR